MVVGVFHEGKHSDRAAVALSSAFAELVLQRQHRRELQRDALIVEQSRWALAFVIGVVTEWAPRHDRLARRIAMHLHRTRRDDEPTRGGRVPHQQLRRSRRKRLRDLGRGRARGGVALEVVEHGRGGAGGDRGHDRHRRDRPAGPMRARRLHEYVEPGPSAPLPPISANRSEGPSGCRWADRRTPTFPAAVSSNRRAGGCETPD